MTELQHGVGVVVLIRPYHELEPALVPQCISWTVWVRVYDVHDGVVVRGGNILDQMEELLELLAFDERRVYKGERS